MREISDEDKLNHIRESFQRFGLDPDKLRGPDRNKWPMFPSPIYRSKEDKWPRFYNPLYDARNKRLRLIMR